MRHFTELSVGLQAYGDDIATPLNVMLEAVTHLAVFVAELYASPLEQ